MIVPVVIYPGRPANLQGVHGRALIDTGSTTTGIVGGIARALDLARRGKKPMGGIGGEQQVERYLFRIGLDSDGDTNDAPQFPFVFEDVEGFEMRNGFAFDVLLGMDILHQCDLTLDRTRTARLTFG